MIFIKENLFCSFTIMFGFSYIVKLRKRKSGKFKRKIRLLTYIYFNIYFQNKASNLMILKIDF